MDFDPRSTTPVGFGPLATGEQTAALLREILAELKAIHKVVEPEYDIYFSPKLNLTRKQKQAAALAACKAMKEAEPT